MRIVCTIPPILVREVANHFPEEVFLLIIEVEDVFSIVTSSAKSKSADVSKEILASELAGIYPTA